MLRTYEALDLLIGPEFNSRQVHQSGRWMTLMAFNRPFSTVSPTRALARVSNGRLA